MSISLTHKNPTGVRPIVFDQLLERVEPLLCVMVQTYVSGPQFRGNISQKHARISLEFLIRQRILAEATNGVVAIASVVFFPGLRYQTINEMCRSLKQTSSK